MIIRLDNPYNKGSLRFIKTETKHFTTIYEPINALQQLVNEAELCEKFHVIETEDLAMLNLQLTAIGNDSYFAVFELYAVARYAIDN